MIKRLVWLMPNWVHDLIWIATGRVLMGWKDDQGRIARIEWKRLKDGKYS